ncbi:MAG: tRNA (adenosine(37)-N6)-threonylcarbamoyltransferase complex dimerization subunit type 1 TsaB [Bacteroidota bacterium]
MSKLLLLETATEICSVAITEAAKIIAKVDASENYAHTEKLTLLIEEVAQKAMIALKDLEAVAISKGPGSYTALRVGTSVAKGLCFALDLPLIAIDTLASLADAAYQKIGNENALYCPMIDARRMEVYAALYDANGHIIQDQQAMIIDENSFHNYFKSGQPIIFCGNGAEKCKSVLTHPLAHFETTVCDASNLRRLASNAYQQQQFEDLAYFVPIYGKAPNITTSKKGKLRN